MEEKLIDDNNIEEFLKSGTVEKASLFSENGNQREKVVLFHVFNPSTGLYENKYLTKIKNKSNK